MSLPVKGDIVINPNTQRPVKVGSRTWLNLVKKGVFEGRYREKSASNVHSDNYDKKGIVQSPPRKFSDGKNSRRKTVKDRVVKRKIPKGNNSRTEMSKYTAQIASKVVNNNIDTLSEADDFSQALEQLILQELTNVNSEENDTTNYESEDSEPEDNYIPPPKDCSNTSRSNNRIVKSRTRGRPKTKVLQSKKFKEKQQEHANDYWQTQEVEEDFDNDEEYYE